MMNGENFKVGQSDSRGMCRGRCRGMNLISQSNELVRAAYRLSLDELRLVLLAASKVDSRGGAARRGDDGIKILAREWRDAFEISEKNSYTQLRRAARGLWSREITKISGREREDLRWVWRKAEFPDGGGAVTLYFSPGVLEYLQNLGGGFTQYRLSRIANFRSVYSIRIFQLCAQFRKTGRAWVALEDLHEILQTPVSYRRRFASFERFVVDPAVKEIRHSANLDLKWARVGDLLEFSFDPADPMFLRRPL